MLSIDYYVMKSTANTIHGRRFIQFEEEESTHDPLNIASLNKMSNETYITHSGSIPFGISTFG